MATMRSTLPVGVILLIWSTAVTVAATVEFMYSLVRFFAESTYPMVMFFVESRYPMVRLYTPMVELR